MNIYKYLLTISLFFIFSNCKSIKPSASKEGVKLYETFFVGEEGTQYYIKPLQLKNKAENLLIDTTFRYNKNIDDSKPVDIKISLVSVDFIKEIETLTIKNTKGFLIAIDKSDIELLFNDQSKNGYLSRFSTKCTLSDFKKLNDDNSWEIVIDQRPVFTTTSRTEKKLAKLNKSIFVLL